MSYGVVLFNGCGLTRLSQGLAKIEQVPEARLRQRLREFYYDADAKRGKKRRAVDVHACFRDLLRAIVHNWQGNKELALALDASTLGERFTVLNLSVMYRGCGIPVAWILLPAHQEGSWRPHWEQLLEQVAGAVPADWKVIVLADRGLYAAWLFTAIQKLGWHPFLRVNDTMGFRAEGEADFRPIGSRVRRRGRGWSGRGEWSEQGERMQGTLLIRWEKGYDESVAVVTDMAPEEANVSWYFQRFWVEGEYKDHKSGGYGWEQTKMTDPKRAERLWLVMAVAMLITVLVGGLEEAQEQEQRAQGARKASSPRRRGRPAKAWQRPRGREQSCLMRGQQRIQAAVIRGEALPQGYGVSEAWPTQTYPRSKPASSWLKKCKTKKAARKHEQKRQQRASQQQAAPRQLSQQERIKRQRQAMRARAAQNAVREQQEREDEHTRAQQEQAAQRLHTIQQNKQKQEARAQKREVRKRVREEHEVIREQRRLWHEEVQRDREARLRRREERAARGGSQTQCSSLASSTILALPHALAEPLEPP